MKTLSRSSHACIVTADNEPRKLKTAMNASTDAQITYTASSAQATLRFISIVVLVANAGADGIISG